MESPTINNSLSTKNYKQLLVRKLSFRRGFTLVEILVVVGLIAILSTAVLLTLNPLDFLKQGRDSTRLNDLSNLMRTLNYIQAESPQTFFGNPKTIYISRPDPNLTGDATSTCPNMNLPPIPTDWSYYCVSPQNLSRIDGKGWIPIDFSNQAIFRLSKLPTDPQNNENYYYTYVYDPNTQTFEIDTALESQKQKHLLSEDNGDNNNLYELGTNLTLYPIGGIGQNFALKNESNQFLKNESNYAIYVAQAAGTGQVSFFIAPDQVTGDNNLFWDNTNKRLGIWTTSPASKLSVSGGVSIGSTYAGTAAPVDGMIIQGNVGIGTTGPSGLLDVGGGKLAVTSGGNVGIGTTTPGAKLEVTGNNVVFRVDTTTFGTARLQAIGPGSNWGILTLEGLNGGGVQINPILSTGLKILRPTYNLYSSLVIDRFNSDRSDRYAILIDDESGNGRFVVTGAGYVGVGTTTPGAKLSIHANAGETNNALFSITSSTASAVITLLTVSNNGDVVFSDGTRINSWNLGDLEVMDTAGNRTISIGQNGVRAWKGNLSTNYSLIVSGTGNSSIAGNLGIGTTTPAYKLDVAGDIRTSGCLVYNGGTLGTCSSDIRLKDNIMNLTFDNAIEKVIKLQPKKFVFKQDPNHEMHGLIAQEVEEFAPELVITDQNGYKQIKYGDIQWLMLQTIQEQQKQIDELKHRIEILEKNN